MKSLLSINERLLDQAISLIQSHTPQDYVRRCGEVFSSSIGQHIRHCVEHYEEFLDAVREQRELDYEKRPRDLAVEMDPDEAVRRLQGIRDALDSSLDECREILVWDHGAATPAASSWSRELQYLLSHTVHHFALIAVIASLADLPVPDDFGVAPSTLKYRESADV